MTRLSRCEHCSLSIFNTPLARFSINNGHDTASFASKLSGNQQGSETDGSTIRPATRASLYGMKASVGAVSGKGAMTRSAAFDGHGAMALTPRDLSDLMGILMGKRGFSTFLRGSRNGLKIGFVESDVWHPTWFVNPHEGVQKTDYGESEKKSRAAGAHVAENVPLITLAELAHVEDGLPLDNMIDGGLPDRKAQGTITIMFAVHGIDAVVGLADARMQSVASLAGYAVGTMSLGYADFKHRAWGLAVIAGAGGEGKMLEIMSAWESIFGGQWKLPPQLRDWVINDSLRRCRGCLQCQPVILSDNDLNDIIAESVCHIYN